jgi:hypothetical protein
MHKQIKRKLKNKKFYYKTLAEWHIVETSNNTTWQHFCQFSHTRQFLHKKTLLSLSFEGVHQRVSSLLSPITPGRPIILMSEVRSEVCVQKEISAVWLKKVQSSWLSSRWGPEVQKILRLELRVWTPEVRSWGEEEERNEEERKQSGPIYIFLSVGERSLNELKTFRNERLSQNLSRRDARSHIQHNVCRFSFWTSL